MSGAAERNTEIWSTRLQRELLALTTDNAPEDAKDAVQTILPSFVSVHNHELNIEKGDCLVSFLVDYAVKGDDAAEKAKIVVTLNASLQKKPEGGVDPIAVAYPFMKPVAILTSGSERFPEGSTIKDGDLIEIEMDWTPSLHLTDAILNVALKIKESVSQGETFHPAPPVENKVDPVGDMVDRAKRIGSSFRKGINSLADPEKKKTVRPSRKKKKMKESSPGEVRIGDEINMLEAPWVDCQGVYSCKAIRRPNFVEEAMAIALQNIGEKPTESPQANSPGFAGAGAMLRTFTQSARSVLEESFLMITESHIIEMRSNKLNLSTGTVTFAIPIEMLAKLKFRRQESISLFFKPAPDDPLIYMCPDSADCVHQIQAVLKRHGVKGKHTNAATHRAINQALHLVQEIQTKELALKHDPNVDRVNEIMDLYRQAAERFEVAGDIRHEEVVTHMRKFLALPLTVSILEGTYKKPESETRISNDDGEGVVLESSPLAMDDTEQEGEGKPAASPMNGAGSEDKTFEANMESILREAEADLANMRIINDEDDPEYDAVIEEDTNAVSQLSEEFEGLDAIADFENMLKEADNELAELMAS